MLYEISDNIVYVIVAAEKDRQLPAMAKHNTRENHRKRSLSSGNDIELLWTRRVDMRKQI